MDVQQASLRGCQSLAVMYNPYNFGNYCSGVWYLLRNALQIVCPGAPLLPYYFFLSQFCCLLLHMGISKAGISRNMAGCGLSG